MSEDSAAAKNLLADRRCENCFYLAPEWGGSKNWCRKRHSKPQQMTCSQWKESNSEEQLIALASAELKKSLDQVVGKAFGDSLKEKLDETSLRTAKLEDSIKQIQDLLGQTLSEFQDKYGDFGKSK